MRLKSIGCMAVFESWSKDARRTNRGFTLVEVLIAFAILAVALTALMQAFSQGLRSLEVAEDYATATMLARSKMAEIGPLIAVEESELTGEFENGWQWRVAIVPFADDGDPDVELGAVTLFDVNVAIERDDRIFAELYSLRIGTPP